MKPLKATQQIVESNKWVRINYLTENEHAFGYYILKSDLYFNNVKTIGKEIMTVQELYDRLIEYLNIHDDHPELTIELLDELVERLQKGEKLDG